MEVIAAPLSGNGKAAPHGPTNREPNKGWRNAEEGMLMDLASGMPQFSCGINNLHSRETALSL
jgi:hypothetical protein